MVNSRALAKLGDLMIIFFFIRLIILRISLYEPLTSRTDSRTDGRTVSLFQLVSTSRTTPSKALMDFYLLLSVYLNFYQLISNPINFCKPLSTFCQPLLTSVNLCPNSFYALFGNLHNHCQPLLIPLDIQKQGRDIVVTNLLCDI